MTSRAAIILALAVMAVGAATAQVLENTTGKRMDIAPGYTFVSNVAGYLRVSNDVCEVNALLNTATPNFAAAKKLYTDGKNSKKSSGAIRTLESMATGDYSGGLFWDTAVKHFKSPLFIDEIINKALSGAAPFTSPLVRRELAMKAISSNLMTAYTMHEMDEAAAKLKESPPAISDASGAPHNVDEAVALYIGEKSECSPWGISNKRAAIFGTQDTCKSSKANTEFVKAANAALAAARKGDIKAFTAARSRVQAAFAITAVQATIQYAEEMEAARVAKKPTDDLQAEGYAFFRSIEPLVAQASASSAETIKKLLYPGNPVVAGANTQVVAALEKAYAGLGITKADVGTYGAKSTLKC